jgi:hypothetical protein
MLYHGQIVALCGGVIEMLVVMAVILAIHIITNK